MADPHRDRWRLTPVFGINALNEVAGSSGVLETGGPDHATLWTLK